MSLHFRRCLFLLTLLSCFIFSTSPSHADNFRPKTTLNIGVSFAIPPWVITETDSGIELDILKQALEPFGYEVLPNYLSFALSYSLYKAGKLDGVLNAKESLLSSGFFSDEVVTFQNVAISLKEKNYPEDITPSFLADKSVVAFQNASDLLGLEFQQMSKHNELYQEVAKQSLQINLLMIRNIDFIIMDKSIFGYYWREAQTNPNLIRVKSKLKQAIQFHPMFEPSPYRFVFKTREVRDDFNEGLAKLKQSGEYDEIFRRYEHLNDLYISPSD